MGCRNFLASECVDGSCPMTPKGSDNDMISDMASLIYEDVKDCTQCYYNTNKCEDCIFQNTNLCEEVKHE